MNPRNLLFHLSFIGIVMNLCGCGGENDARIAELHNMQVLWESEIIISEPSMPELNVIVPMYDSIDPTFRESLRRDDFTADYIPESVMAFANPNYRGKLRVVTLHIGDMVEVLDYKTNNTGRDICLIRTFSDTYAWIYSFHLNDRNGIRMASFK